jgi:hypothetical protein
MVQGLTVSTLNLTQTKKWFPPPVSKAIRQPALPNKNSKNMAVGTFLIISGVAPNNLS